MPYPQAKARARPGVQKAAPWPGPVLLCGLLTVLGCGFGGVGPDGGSFGVDRLAFVRDGQLFTSEVNSSHLKALTDPGTFVSPVWSPDGSQIAFFRAVVPDSMVASVIPAEGGEIRDLVPVRYVSFGSLEWSPDGRFLLFLSSNRFDSGQRLEIVDAASGSRRTFPADVDTFIPISTSSWSPRGDRIFYSELRGLQWDIFSVSADGTGPVQVTDDPGNDIYPRVSPDGSKMAFYAFRSGGPRLYVQDLPGGQSRKLTEVSDSARWMLWSPDGTQVAFQGGGHLYTIGADGRGERRITTTQAPYVLESWSPDGRYLAYKADLEEVPFTREAYEFYVVDLESGEHRQVLNVGFDVDLLWVRR